MAVDWVAFSSVVSSGVVAAGSLFATYRGQKLQRRHEAEQAFETRAWAEKSETLYNVIAWSRELADAMKSGSETAKVEGISQTIGRFQRVIGGVEAYASPKARDDFSALRSSLAKSGVDASLVFNVAEIREGMYEAMDRQEFEQAATARHREKNELEFAIKRMKCDPVAIGVLCEQLIEHCRDSLHAAK